MGPRPVDPNTPKQKEGETVKDSLTAFTKLQELCRRRSPQVCGLLWSCGQVPRFREVPSRSGDFWLVTLVIGESSGCSQCGLWLPVTQKMST